MKSAGMGSLIAGLIALGTAFVLTTLLPSVAAWCAVVGLALTTAGTFLMAGSVGRRSRALLLVAIASGVIVAAGLAAALLLPAEVPNGVLWLGLPRRAAIVLIGVGLLPAAILPWVYARSGDDSPEESDRFVAECRRVAQGVEEG